MDIKKAREVVEEYRRLLGNLKSQEGPFNKQPSKADALRHTHSMLGRMEGFLDNYESEVGSHKDWDKFNRWLGFMQGVFWLTGTYTLNEMRDHNRTGEKES